MRTYAVTIAIESVFFCGTVRLGDVHEERQVHAQRQCTTTIWAERCLVSIN